MVIKKKKKCDPIAKKCNQLPLKFDFARFHKQTNKSNKIKGKQDHPHRNSQSILVSNYFPLHFFYLFFFFNWVLTSFYPHFYAMVCNSLAAAARIFVCSWNIYCYVIIVMWFGIPLCPYFWHINLRITATTGQDYDLRYHH